jgi:hypothetical protein
MLTKSGAKLIDFGLVKSVAATFHGVTHPRPDPITRSPDDRRDDSNLARSPFHRALCNCGNTAL